MRSHFILAAVLACLSTSCDRRPAEANSPELERLRREAAELKLKLLEQETQLKAAETDVALQTQAASKAAASAETATRTAEAAAAREEAARGLVEERTKLEADRTQMLAQLAQLDATQRADAEAKLRRREEAWQEEQRRIGAERDAAKAALAEARAQQKAELARREAEAREQIKQAGTRRTLDLFYDALNPHGDWLELEKYGFAFQPAVSQKNPAWRPYTDGSWVSTDQGWVWKSKEPFGWATFHYGRWLRLVKRGWVWIPGTEWAPAWVAWRWSSTHIGWAPLPPEAMNSNGFNSGVDDYYDIGASNYVFVPRNQFCEAESYAERMAPVAQNLAIISKTENITNLTYGRVNQQRVVINRGPDPQVLAVEREKPVPMLKIEKREAFENVALPPKSGVIEVAAPVIEDRAVRQPRGAKPKEVAERDRGWNGMAPDIVHSLRERFAIEARKAEAITPGIPQVATPPSPSPAGPIQQKPKESGPLSK